MAIFKLYSYSGKRLLSIEDILSTSESRILAVPRNERPVFRGNAKNMQLPSMAHRNLTLQNQEQNSLRIFLFYCLFKNY